MAPRSHRAFAWLSRGSFRNSTRIRRTACASNEATEHAEDLVDRNKFCNSSLCMGGLPNLELR